MEAGHLVDSASDAVDRRPAAPLHTENSGGTVVLYLCCDAEYASSMAWAALVHGVCPKGALAH